MPITKRLVCLANSRKLGGTCVAGKVVDQATSPWVRPVSGRPDAAVMAQERCYEDGCDPQVLDIIDVPLKHHEPKAFQSENWLLDPERRWTRVGRLLWADLDRLVDDPISIWFNLSSTSDGLFDRVALQDAEGLDNSLYLLRLESLNLRVFAPGVDFGNPKRRVQAGFTHRDTKYQLWVTDRLVEEEYRAKPDGTYAVGPCFVTVSLGEPHEGYCYKLVAAVIAPPQR